ncbi:TetR/AcrR family transcriptional regulator C-terminal domain-containing protein [Streptomyces sp. NBC_01264]|uniref:TetR/AcrR family transcriptional regulator C-terminal domain-containing protein n=1 Tax=Streptomyces sp. NBC_01264 TaxID=2903804 RepID=UPI00224C95B7|nr:TetR/AcrR family transcriptional regulator C-terminal domain-containing protein [Streptomyces sp. NBC_01264]MCX4776115.1 TetR/AcrR family transcriptional regulator C-terminal domain-containing protein [Streptomyces sp. NBC_01264]
MAEEHPWLATQLAQQLSRGSEASVAPRIFEALGQRVRALGAPEASWFTIASALVHCILGVAGRHAANAASARTAAPGVSREDFLSAAARAWQQSVPDQYPFTRAVAGQIEAHDDRAQFLAGIDLILAGVTAQYL